LNRRFLTFHIKSRPYIILKWAQTADHKIAYQDEKRLLISNDYSNRMVHQWRSEEAGILIGRRTALLDNPALNTRLSTGPAPTRLVLDNDLTLPASLQIFDDRQRTIIFNSHKHEEKGNIIFYQLPAGDDYLQRLMQALFKLNILSVLVEGGATLLQSFIDEDLWDEARIITNSQLMIGNGLAAPKLIHDEPLNELQLLDDQISISRHR
jgi:diaminohydroxyphosphoribosylaminopyrimidine deaminase/5-amino-6-(5-phosphoribosylamino)uracil reductase